MTEPMQGQLRRRAVRRGLAVALVAPAAAAGAGTAVLLAAVTPPFGALTGLDRWTVFPWIAGLSLVLSLWLCAGPPTAAAWLAAGRRWAAGPCGLPDWRAGAAAAAVSALLLGPGAALTVTRGALGPALWQELEYWGPIFAVACAAAAVWCHLCVRVMLRLDGGAAERRGA